MGTVTQPATPQTPAPGGGGYAVTSLPVKRFTVDEYHRLIEQGYFAAGERFELLEGLIVAKMSRNPPHDAAVDSAGEAIRTRLPGGWRVRTQSAITTAESEPEPDLVVAAGAARDYTTRHPGPGDIALVVEVSNTSLAEDRDVKSRLYARAGIAVYWIINLIDRRVEVYSDPSGPGAAPAYRRRNDFGSGQAVPLAVGGTVVGPIPVAELLP